MYIKRILLTLLSFALIFLFFQYDQSNNLLSVDAAAAAGGENPNESKGYPYDAKINPTGFQKKQTVTKSVKATNPGRPGVYWYQMDDGGFQADQYDGTKVETKNIGDNGDNPIPAKKAVTGRVDSYNYKPGTFDDNNSIPTDVESYPFDSVKSSLTKSTIFKPGSDEMFYSNGSLTIEPDKRYVKFTVTTGGEPFSDKVALSHIKPRPNGYVKYQINYNVAIDFVWEGTVKEIKEISLSGSNQMAIGETKNFTAAVKTKPFSEPSDTGFKSPVDVTTRPEATWSSDNKAVVEVVDPNSGQVKAKAKGKATITVKWESGMYTLYDKILISVEDGEVPPTDPEPQPGDVTCTEPQPAQSISGKYMDPVVTAVIKADSRGSEKFDVLQGIPTSESLYGNVKAKEYLYQDKFNQMKGVCTYTVNVKKTYMLEWDPGKTVANPDGKGTHTEPDPQHDKDEKVYSYSIQRPYSFWKIDNLEVYDINHATLKNYAWDEISIHPSGYNPPVFQANQDGKYYPPDPPEDQEAPSQTLNGGKSRPTVPNEQGAFQGMAEQSVGKVEVENDSLDFNGQKIMNNQRTPETGPTPSQIPAPQLINDNVLYSPGHMISSSKTNKSKEESTGQIFYNIMTGNINGGTDQDFSIQGINPVTVHTPVVNYSTVSDDAAHNQKTYPNGSRSALILERPFTVSIPTSGQHTNYPGYGNRDYAKYFRIKQVQFPFDVYNANKTQFIPKETWVDIPVGQLDTTFYLPVWVNEGDYQVTFRNIAENAPNGFTSQTNANTNLSHHAAELKVPVEVIGRLYDFHITDIADYNWEKVFRTQSGSANQTGMSYWVGQNLIDGDPRGNKATFTLPIRPGSNPLQGYKNVSVKTGYHFKFDFKTKGNMFEALDGIRITPSFFYVSKDGKTLNANGDSRVPVDLYYNTSKNNFVKVGSAEDKVQRYVILNDRLRNVPAAELTDTASYKYNHYGQTGSLSKNQYVQNYMNVFTKQKTPVGSYSLMILPEQVRTFLRLTSSIPASVDQERANVSIQKWYGEYSLPAEPFVVIAGTNVAEYGRTHGGLDSKSPIFLKNGYIIVNFNIESIQQGDLKRPHLQYIYAPLMNQWKMEGFNRDIQDAYGNRFKVTDGDIIFYNADQSSRDDFSSQVPH
ncbi:DUF5704 domain-containing protein [Paenibacillus dokdonensis]|uniref:DUF5704 domain-containing protein n=1 Tax=Paenibacillus dokdonensis TaxID=2567944 RepID=UPI0010A88E68|nr:DUF5704 domain-containing protein [Paenibacillus dokdonensis]